MNKKIIDQLSDFSFGFMFDIYSEFGMFDEKSQQNQNRLHQLKGTVKENETGYMLKPENLRSGLRPDVPVSRN